MNKTLLVGAIGLVIGLALGFMLQPSPSVFGGRIHNIQESFDAGIAVNGTEVISSGRAISAAALSATSIAGTSFSLDSGTSLGEFSCNTKTFNPGSLASSSVDGLSSTSTDVAMTGAAMGDLCVASLSSATSSAAVVSCAITGTATSTFTLFNTGADALDIATGTVRVCYFGF